MTEPNQTNEPAANDRSTNERTTVYYDGSCPLCRTEIGFMRRRDRDGRVEFADIAADPSVLPEGLTPDRAMARFHVRDASGTLRDGAAGFAAMWAELPALRPLAWIARVPGVTWVLERLYRGFLRVRPRLQPLALRWERRRGAQDARRDASPDAERDAA